MESKPRLRQRYFKDGRKMPMDYKPESIPELEDLLDKIYARIDYSRSQEQRIIIEEDDDKHEINN